MSNGFCVRGTLDLLTKGSITEMQATEIVNMWIEITARKFYAEGELDGKRAGIKRNRTWQSIRDMVPERDTEVSLSRVKPLGEQIPTSNSLKAYRDTIANAITAGKI